MNSHETMGIDHNKWYTIDEAISAIGTGKFQYKLLFLTGFIWAADAMEMMLLSFLIPKLKEDWSLEKPEDGLIGFVVFLGNFFGTIFFAILSDRFGRRKVVIACNFFCALFGTLTGLAPNIYILLICRFAVGFTIGGAAVSYVLFAEYAPKELRGMLLIIEQGFWSFGALFSVFLAWITLTYANWRWYLILSAVPLWIISIFYKWVPESCRYLLASGQYYQAQVMLKRLAQENKGQLPNGHLKSIHLKYLQQQHSPQRPQSNNNNNNNNNTQTQNTKNTKNENKNDNNSNNSIDSSNSNNNNNNTNTNTDTQTISSPSMSTLADDASLENTIIPEFETSKISVQRGRIKDAFVPAYRHTSILLLISFFLVVFGYYGISFISERFFESSDNDSSSSDSNSSNNDQFWEMAITTSSEIPGLIIGSLLLDKLGRKKSMIYSFGIYSICCFLLMFNIIQINKGLSVLFMFLGRMCVSLGFLVIYVYYSEYYPTVIRTTTLGFASSLGRIAGMITSFISEDVSLTYGMLLYGIGGAISTICVCLLEQDTTGMDMPTEINKNKKNHLYVNSKTGHVELQAMENDNDNDNDMDVDTDDIIINDMNIIDKNILNEPMSIENNNNNSEKNEKNNDNSHKNNRNNKSENKDNDNNGSIEHSASNSPELGD